MDLREVPPSPARAWCPGSSAEPVAIGRAFSGRPGLPLPRWEPEGFCPGAVAPTSRGLLVSQRQRAACAWGCLGVRGVLVVSRAACSSTPPPPCAEQMLRDSAAQFLVWNRGRACPWLCREQGKLSTCRTRAHWESWSAVAAYICRFSFCALLLFQKALQDMVRWGEQLVGDLQTSTVPAGHAPGSSGVCSASWGLCPGSGAASPGLWELCARRSLSREIVDFPHRYLPAPSCSWCFLTCQHLLVHFKEKTPSF